jgi:RNA polymerase sigma factor (sigma-70 family)
MALYRDARLARAARRGDDGAFERLHALHQASVLAFCRHLTGNREDAEDAVQHTFLAAYRRIEDCEEATDWRPWLFTVARNRCLTLLRARRAESPLVDPEMVAAVDGLAVEVERRHELRDLVRDMARLPEPQRAALVLSQLDALSYREIGSVLDVKPEKVKALVYQARSTLAAAREAREAPCQDIRHEIATARGSALRRRLLRRHVGQCEGCREFEVAVMRQRHDLGILLPLAPSVGLGQAILGSTLGREGATAASAGGAAVATGGAGAGFVGGLAALGAGGALKLAVVVAIAGSGAAGAFAADLPQRIEHAGPWAGDRAGERATGRAEATPGETEGGSPTPDRRAGALPVVGGRSDDGSERRESPGGGPERMEASGAGEDDGVPGVVVGDGRPGGGGDDGGGANPPAADGGGPANLPPGLAKKDELPPGLAKRDRLPPGLAKRVAATPGKSGKAPAAKQPTGGGGVAKGNNGNGNGGGQGSPATGSPGSGGQGNGGASPGTGQGNAGGQGNSNGNSNGNSQGNAGGQGNANGNGNGNANGNAGGNGNGGGAGGQGNAGGNGNGNGNGGGSPH